eukprot:CAMPEP_0115495270 /NCGR_PEP_ID=MMETSP0271-20121206/65164_1 /TAXON_ID=71861 /ORGANISM="Scrippsiella trochoidea, Strain CCMP3099" /LENGTH=165 /DNA_ID=CAMNT_0002923905 /DNA_START=174 /DNA_END=668 /DNA_ORIENTATION=+
MASSASAPSSASSGHSSSGEEARQGQEVADKKATSLRVEVFDGSDSMQALFHSTNLRIRVSELGVEEGRTATRDLHEDDLEPWLEDVGAAHLLTASREADLVEVLLQHAAFSESVGAPSVILKGIGHETLTHGRFAAGTASGSTGGSRCTSIELALIDTPPLDLA